MRRKNMRTRRKKLRRGGMLKAVRRALNGCVGRTCRARLAGRNNEEKEENAARLAENAETRARIEAAAAPAARSIPPEGTRSSSSYSHNE